MAQGQRLLKMMSQGAETLWLITLDLTDMNTSNNEMIGRGFGTFCSF